MNVLNAAPGLMFKRLLLGFWTMFFGIAAVTNFIDLMGALDIFHWTFLNSGNFELMSGFVKVYDVGATPTKLLLVGALAIEVAAAVLFWWAVTSLGRRPDGQSRSVQALCWGTFVWISFIFMSEFFIAYTGESVFRELLTIMIVTGLALFLVPDDARPDQQA